MDQIEQKAKELFQQIPFGNNGGNILDSNVVYSLEVEGDKAVVILVISEENKRLENEVTQSVKDGLKAIEGINQIEIKTVKSESEMEPKQSAPDPNPAQPEQASYLQEYKNVILVASGKGGVGKSTVSINLALALKARGKKVSIMDADVYGPSVPMMLGRRNEPLQLEGNQIKPLNQFGIDFMSVGNMVQEDQALIWRGPMTHQVIQQILRDAAWPGGDYMIIDLPPGTGDVQLSLSQLTQALGAVVVCTPQDVALLDAKKAISMFEKVNVPILGMVENMSSFICPKCGEETPIFSKGGTVKESDAQNVPFLGSIPIEMDIRLGSDNGDPVVNAMPKSSAAKAFMDIADKLIEIVEAN